MKPGTLVRIGRGGAGMSAPEIHPPLPGQDGQYALIVLNQEQLRQLVQPRRLPVIDALRPAWRRRPLLAGAAALVVAFAAAAAWEWFPSKALAAVLPWNRPAHGPTVATAASFSVTVGASRGMDQASALVGDLLARGMPAYLDADEKNRSAHQVLVGPFVSLDEAEMAQRRLNAEGFAGTRLFVDEAMRRALKNDVRPAVPENPSVVLVSAPDRLALALELRSEPRRVSSRWADESTLELDIGPVDGTIRAQRWSAPAGAHLVRSVEIVETGDAAQLKYARARIVLPEFARSSVRVEGRRIYVDLTWPQLAIPTAPRRRAPALAAAPAESLPDAAARYAAGLAPLLDRFAEVTPFLLSSVQTASPDVLRAVDQPLASLESSLAALTPPEAGRAAHASLLSGIQAARRAVDPAFAGNRLLQAQEGVALFAGGKAALPAR